MAAGSGATKTKVVDTPYLKITGNCLEIENTRIQLSNISLFSTVNVEPAELSKLLFDVALVLIGLFMLSSFLPVALILIAVGGGLAYLWYRDWDKAKHSQRLSIVTNSGLTYSIVFEDQKFLAQVVNVITEILREPEHTKGVMVDIRNGTFINSTIAGEVHNRGGR